MFNEYDLVHSYSRRRAIEDGTLIELDAKMTSEAGIKYPCAITATLHAELLPSDDDLALGQSLEGRLWDCLSAFRFHASRSTDGEYLTFNLIVVRANRQEQVEVIAHCGPGDSMEPVLTLMVRSDL